MATLATHGAMRNLNAATALGVTEAYHESVCLFHAHFLNSLPAHCKCQNPEVWVSYVATDAAYGVSYGRSIDDMPEEGLEKVDAMTLDRAAVKRFMADVQKVEDQFGSKILCDG